jgi:hypothetical protein
MGIRFYCPQGHKLNVKEFQAGRRGICPYCGEKILIPTQSSRPSSKEERQARRAGTQAMAAIASGSPAAPATAVAPPLHHPEVAEEELPLRDPVAAEPSPSVSEGPSANDGFQPAQLTTPLAPAGIAGVSSTMPDPLADSAEVVWYVRPPTGGQFGPAAPQVIRGWLAEGRISADTLVWREGWRDWLEAGGVFPQLNSVYLDPLAALNIPAPMEVIPQRTAQLSLPAKRGVSRRLLWIIAAILLALIAVLGIVLWQLRG